MDDVLGDLWLLLLEDDLRRLRGLRANHEGAVRTWLALFASQLARSGQEALRALLDEEFSVILLDVTMPGMYGFETAQLIRDRNKTRVVSQELVNSSFDLLTHASS